MTDKDTKTTEATQQSNSTENIEEPAIFDAKFDLEHQEIKKRFIIFSSQRTGSTYITRRLCNLKDQFGVPAEYFHEFAFRDLLPRLIPKPTNGEQKVSIENYLKAIEQTRTTKDGYFGIKVQPHHLINIFKQRHDLILKFIEGYDLIILMTRKDKLAQAISCSISAITNKWHTGDQEPVLNDAQLTRAHRLMIKNTERFFSEEEFILFVKNTLKKPILHIEYEDIDLDANLAFEKVVEFLSAGEKKESLGEENMVPVPKKSSNQLSLKLKANFMDYVTGSLKTK